MNKYKGYNIPDIGDYIPLQSLLDDVGIDDDDADGISTFYCDQIEIGSCTDDDCKQCMFGSQNKKQDKVFMEWHEARKSNRQQTRRW